MRCASTRRRCRWLRDGSTASSAQRGPRRCRATGTRRARCTPRSSSWGRPPTRRARSSRPRGPSWPAPAVDGVTALTGGRFRDPAPAFFVFFLVSGFCSLVYEVVWLRLAMAQFGVTTALVSIVLSVFMAGLALGSWGAGRLARGLRASPAATLVRLYAAAELLIASSATVVPAVLAWGRATLASDAAGTWGSRGYHLASAGWVTLAMLPFCIGMGATFPLAMEALRRFSPSGSARSFSYLYVANLAGATAGTLVSAFVLVELLGFRGTLALTAALNAFLAAAALGLSLVPAPHPAPAGESPRDVVPSPRVDGLVGGRILWALFITGFASMAMEVVWVRQLTPYLGNVVY